MQPCASKEAENRTLRQTFIVAGNGFHVGGMILVSVSNEVSEQTHLQSNSEMKINNKLQLPIKGQR